MSINDESAKFVSLVRAEEPQAEQGFEVASMAQNVLAVECTKNDAAGLTASATSARPSICLRSSASSVLSIERTPSTPTPRSVQRPFPGPAKRPRGVRRAPNKSILARRPIKDQLRARLPSPWSRVMFKLG